jgi:hypothetical protein
LYKKYFGTHYKVIEFSIISWHEEEFEFESIGTIMFLNFSSTAVDAVENKEVQVQHRKFSSIMFSCRDQTDCKTETAIVMSKASLNTIYIIKKAVLQDSLFHI